MKFLQILFTTIAIVLLTGAVLTHYVSKSTVSDPLLVREDCSPEIATEELVEELESCDEDYQILDSDDNFNNHFCSNIFGYCVPYLYTMSVSAVVFYVFAEVMYFLHKKRKIRNHKKKIEKKPSNEEFPRVNQE